MVLLVTVMGIVLLSRRQLLRSGLALASLGLLAGCGQLPFSVQPTPKPTRIGHLSLGDFRGPTREAWEQGLREHGWVDGQNLTIEYRYAEGRIDRFPELAAELTRLNVDAIFTGGGVEAIRALRSATGVIPIVTVSQSDLVEEGLVTSHASPGGNVTGISVSPQVSGKRLQLLKEALPRVSRAALLWYAGQRGQARAAEDAAKRLDVELLSLEVRDYNELARALETAASWPAEALLTSSGPVFSSQQTLMVEFPAARRLPTMYYTSEFVKAGGLMAYGPNSPGMFRQVAVHVDKILRGAKPGDLPIEQPARFDFAINLKAAQALGLTIPPAVLAQATETIQ
jgi:putative tryptophan/tyrosine transport system substrate-binding protein